MPNNTLSKNVCLLNRSLRYTSLDHDIADRRYRVDVYDDFVFGVGFLRCNFLTEFNCNIYYTNMIRVVLDIQYYACCT